MGVCIYHVPLMFSHSVTSRLLLSKNKSLLIRPKSSCCRVSLYQGIVSRGGGQPMPDRGRLRIGARRRAVVAQRERVIAAGDLNPTAGRADGVGCRVGSVARSACTHRLSTSACGCWVPQKAG